MTVIDNFCNALFSGVHKLAVRYNISNIFWVKWEKKIEGNNNMFSIYCKSLCLVTAG